MFAFYIVRHEETLLDGPGRAQGRSNSPLTNNGRKANVHTKKSEDMKNACQQNIGITYYGNDDSRSQWMHHTGKPRPGCRASD